MGLLDSVLLGPQRGLGGAIGGLARRGGGMSPLTLAILGTLAYRTLKGKGRLADILGTGTPAGSAQGGQGSQGGLGGLGGLLSGGALSEGLGNLLNRFRQNGHADAAESWIQDGPNKSLQPEELEQALGSERVTWLMEQTGLSKQELLAGLRGSLPDAVDKLTPNGRLPTPQETQQLM